MTTKTDDSPDLRSVMLMLGSVILFAINTLAIRAIALRFPEADGWLASLFRGIVGLIVVFALHGWGRGLQPRRLFSSRLIILRGIIGGITIIIFYVTIVKLGAARAIILNLTYPVFATLIAAFWLKEKLSRAAVAWMIAGLGGLAIYLGEDGRLMHPSSYDLLALLGAALAGWVVVVIRRLRHEEHPATIYASQAIYSFAMATPAVMKIPQLAAGAWIGLSVAAVIVTVAQLIMTKAYQTMTVAKGSSLQMLLPVFTGIGGFLCFGESFTAVGILGAGLTLFATWRVMMAR